MHNTNAGEKRKAMKREALELAREKARELQGEADTARAEALALKPLARLEDLHIWELEKVKTTKKGSRSYRYWMATWREGDKVRNVHKVNSRKLKARSWRAYW